MSWQEQKKKLNEKLAGLNFLRIEDGDEIDLIFGESGEELFRLHLSYGPGIVDVRLTDCNKEDNHV